MKELKSKHTKLLFWIVLILAFVLALQFVKRGKGPEEIPFSKFIADARTVVGSQVQNIQPLSGIKFLHICKDTVWGQFSDGTQFRSQGKIESLGDNLLLLARRGVQISYCTPGSEPNIPAEAKPVPFSDLLKRALSQGKENGKLELSVESARIEKDVIAIEYKDGSAREIPVSEYVRSLLPPPFGTRGQTAASLVKRVKTKQDEIEVTYIDGTKKITHGDLSKFEHELIDLGIVIEHEGEGAKGMWVQFLISWVPMIAFFLLIFLFIRQLQAGSGRAMSFAKSKHRLLTEKTSKVTFDDIAGIDEAKDELQEIIEFLRDPKKFTRLGGRIPKGVLLMGPPGTGKTLLARGVAGEAGVPFFSISGSDFVEMYVGVGAARVRDLFDQGKKHAPCIIFIDEIDAVGRHRGAGLGGGHDEREQTLNQLLVEMDGFESNEGVILIAATNRPDVLDPALLRPGRFDRRIVIPLPDINGREQILKVHCRTKPIAIDVDLARIARGTPGFSGADLENLVNEAALLAARRGRERIENQDLEDAKDKVLLGAERKSMVLTDEEKRVTAIHEAGHALAARLLPNADPLYKVTVIPRGLSLGLTQLLPEKDRHNYTKSWLEDSIAVMLGGRAAEEICLGEETTGAGQDIEHATELARKMVTQWGMSYLGLVAYEKKGDEVFLGKDFIKAKNYSEAAAAKIDGEVRRIISANYDRVVGLLSQHRQALEALANELHSKEVLTREEVEAIIEPLIPQLSQDQSQQETKTVSTQRHKEKPQEAKPQN